MIINILSAAKLFFFSWIYEDGPFNCSDTVQNMERQKIL
jgi:hypothetical protein